MRATLVIALVAAAVVAAAPASVIAQGRTKTATMLVTAEVVATCTVTPHDVNFGPYDPVGVNKTAPLQQRSSIDLVCTPGTTGAITLDLGQHSMSRQMAMASAGGARLEYALFQDSGMTRPFGGGNFGAVFRAGGQGRYFAWVFGRVTAGQNIPVGSYRDTVLVTVSY